ncbi:peroxidase family protein [Streptomyces sp. NPDC005402]|uniref:peroxidase family protein n=1 Tax=Streptomyces sp. NPDC005402 TaxID=3155338 RepID=UPI0033B21602
MSERRRAARRPTAGDRTSLPWRVVTGCARYVDRHAEWDRLPVPPGLLTLLGLRVRLRQENLHDTGRLPSAELPEPAPPSESHKVNRPADGSHYDLGEPRTGMAGTRFGRNIPRERLYDGDVEKVDLMVGPYAEPLPAGFAFSDTAFRIFVPMASRRLNSDRFCTEYCTPEVYSTAGMAWIDDNSMITVLPRTTRNCVRRSLA